jgi:hypothetical protein
MIVLAFDSSLTLEAMLAKLSALGHWTWRMSDSDTYGESLWTVPGKWAKGRISAVDSHWVIEMWRDPASEELSIDQLRQDILTRVLPALRARNVRPGEATR